MSNLELFADHSQHMRAHWHGKGRRDPALIERVRQVAADQSIPMAELGISYGALSQICRENGILWLSRGYRGRVAGLTERTASEALQGRTTMEAARILGVHPQTLYNRFDHLLTKRASPGVLDPHREEVLRLRRIERIPIAEVGRRYGVSENCVQKSIQRWSRQDAKQGGPGIPATPRLRPGPKRGHKRLGKAW
jgi:transposase-like protein